jgi:TonB family protein
MTKGCLLVATLQCALLSACQTLSPESIPGPVSTAVDAAGVQHSAGDYPKGNVPWIQDLRRPWARPEYPSQERALHHVGAGLFHLELDLRSGVVVSVSILQSTGFKALDESAVVALSRWRWKPGRWKEIEMPVRFTMSQTSIPEHPSTPFDIHVVH